MDNAALRKRYSIQELERLHDSGNTEPLDKVIRAFAYIQGLDADNQNSFQVIAGYHGLSFHDGPGYERGDYWWGGYCFHDNVLFPTWHRAYLLRLEKALQTAPKCEDVMLPFWDECDGLYFEDDGSIHRDYGTYAVPRTFTEPDYTLDGQTIPNPLFSFRLRGAIANFVDPENALYSKPEGYETVRYPFSGLVGEEAHRQDTISHNEQYRRMGQSLLKKNVDNWLRTGPTNIPPMHGDARPPKDITSVFQRYRQCLETETYTLFSNTTSQNKKMEMLCRKENKGATIMSIESPHNAMHLAVGGFFQAGVMNANEISNANGDMGDNETASFDPIFFFHHCFVDYVFWQWQRRWRATDTLTIDEDDPGAKIPKGGIRNLEEGTSVNMDTQLEPFRNGERWYTSNDLVNIENLGYTYGEGSLDIRQGYWVERLEWTSHGIPPTPIQQVVRVSGVYRHLYEGSFVIRTYARGPGRGREIEIGREPILSRWNISRCRNCQNHLEAISMIPLDQEMLDLLLGNDWETERRTVDRITYRVYIQRTTRRWLGDREESRSLQVEHLLCNASNPEPGIPPRTLRPVSFDGRVTYVSD